MPQVMTECRRLARSCYRNYLFIFLDWVIILLATNVFNGKEFDDSRYTCVRGTERRSTALLLVLLSFSCMAYEEGCVQFFKEDYISIHVLQIWFIGGFQWSLCFLLCRFRIFMWRF